MNKEEIKNLAIECGFDYSPHPLINTILITSVELAAYTAAVEAPLQARIAQLESIDEDKKENAELTKLAKSYLDSANVWHDRYMKRCADNESLRQQQGVAIMAVEEELQELTDHINKVWEDTYPDAVPADTMIALKNRVKNLSEDRACWLFNAKVLQNKLNAIEETK